MKKLIEYSKAMVDLVREIRKRVDIEFKPKVKLANQQLFDDLVSLYWRSNDMALCDAIKELFILAGDEWSEKIGV